MSSSPSTKYDDRYNTFERRSEWPKGPWDAEPDARYWQSKHGYKCMVNRNHTMGNLCGYVGIPKGHPWFEKFYDAIYQMSDELDVHGGLTFAARGVGYHEGLWVVGFDCAHFHDRMPGVESYFQPDLVLRNLQQYRDIQYVTRETEALAAQAETAAK